ncbi:tagatose-6-phosphate ketose/aldose isomerase [Pseudoduganella lurida]|uniref:Tagatose-6-phosphate ketose/aldose isomerase n=1 Tax=Pseudoduganella lurida TaxID=1036180 RepID=A0A562RFS3_9BURK|nr:SIS domain-containing protein [Pseudoduganella lurida]TWI67276.1 tagatose-6-phosphate ketose/aldose isomerase [Pseudoduganella lurida]
MSVTQSSNVGFPAGEFEARGATWTAREIAQQPGVWTKVLALVQERSAALDTFLGPLLADPALRIVFTGAGTSAFIGECLVPAIRRHGKLRAEAVPTTDLVAGPDRWLRPDAPTLLVSFGRSGSSPESVAAFDLAEQTVPGVHHLVVTCNKDGELYRRCQSQSNACALLLPDETHDRAFAMTSSFTSMLLSAGVIFGAIRPGPSYAAAAQALLGSAAPLVNALVDGDFERVVYLGSNELGGLAREAALKLLELTDGGIVSGFDTPLGFRHGPKSVVNARTLVVLFLSNDPHTRRYDLDLLRELRNDGRAGRVLALSATADGTAPGDVLLAGMEAATDIELAFPYIAFAQLFALFASLKRGVTPDTPSASGTVNRVVAGVTIYGWQDRA